MLLYHHYVITIADIVTVAVTAPQAQGCSRSVRYAVLLRNICGLHTSVSLCDHHVLDTAVLTHCCTDHVRTQICASTRSSY